MLEAPASGILEAGASQVWVPKPELGNQYYHRNGHHPMLAAKSIDSELHFFGPLGGNGKKLKFHDFLLPFLLLSGVLCPA